jgi:hypothetical protein
MSENALFIVDSPINLLMVSLLQDTFDHIDILFALDTKVKSSESYLSLVHHLCSPDKLRHLSFITYDSSRYWNGKRFKGLTASSFEGNLFRLVRRYSAVYGNVVTNPISRIASKFRKVNYLYHSPVDLELGLLKIDATLLDSTRIVAPNKTLIKLPEGSAVRSLKFYDHRSATINNEESLLAQFRSATQSTGRNVCLLVSGLEPSPGDTNILGIEQFVDHHVAGVSDASNALGETFDCIWIKEHRSYRGMGQVDRMLLQEAFLREGYETRFINLELDSSLHLIPGELILNSGNFGAVIGECSSLLLNMSHTNIRPVILSSAFRSVREPDQLDREAQFLQVNSQLWRPVIVA